MRKSSPFIQINGILEEVMLRGTSGKICPGADIYCEGSCPCHWIFGLMVYGAHLLTRATKVHIPTAEVASPLLFSISPLDLFFLLKYLFYSFKKLLFQSFYSFSALLCK